MSEYINTQDAMASASLDNNHIVMDDSTLNNAKVKVFGVGGAGGNTVNRMVKMEIEGVEYYAVNTDAKALELSLADHKIQIGQKLTKALGAGMRPEVGAKAAEENADELKEAMKGADMIFITAGMGGGTGTGAAPIVGRIARELGILTVAVVTKPFSYEGKRRSTLAAGGIENLRTSVDTVIVVDNEKLMGVVESTDKSLTLNGAFQLTDEILGNAVRSICGIMFRHGLIHVDFADIKTVMTNGGSALMGTGFAEGENRGRKAVDIALSSPLLEDISVEGATGVLVNVSHGENFSMLEFSDAMKHIHEAVTDRNDPNIIMGDILLPELGDKVCITIIATGCGDSAKQAQVQPMFNSADFTPAAMPLASKPSVAETPVANMAQPQMQPQTVMQPQTAMQPQVTQPVQFTPRPTRNFASLARETAVQAPVQPASFASSYFDAKAPAQEEELVTTATATLPETEEMPAIADMDQLSTGNYDTPTIMRQSVTETPVNKVQQESRGTSANDSLKQEGVDYSMPAYLRMGGSNCEF